MCLPSNLPSEPTRDDWLPRNLAFPFSSVIFIIMMMMIPDQSNLHICSRLCTFLFIPSIYFHLQGSWSKMEKECRSPAEVTSRSPTWKGIGLVLLFYGLESVICIHCLPNQVWQGELHLQSKREGWKGGGEVVPAHTHWWECLEWQRLWLRHDPDQKDLAPFFMANLLFRCTRIFSKNYFWCVFFMKKSWFSDKGGCQKKTVFLGYLS